MSVLTLDRPRIETGMPTESLAASDPATGREAAFRSALEAYVADYRRALAPIAVPERHRGQAPIRRSILAWLARLLDQAALPPRRFFDGHMRANPDTVQVRGRAHGAR